MAARVFFGWALEEGECEQSPMANMRPPAIPERPVPIVGDDVLRKLLEAASGKDFSSLRDTALVLLLVGSGLRRGEVAGLTLDDVDLDRDVVSVLGKGNRPRSVPFGAQNSQALDRYIRKGRRVHLRARRTDALWLGPRGALTGSGVAQIIERLRADAGIAKIHPHQLRHTFAHDWLASGESEGDLMRLTGWHTRSMVDRYAASAASERARTRSNGAVRLPIGSNRDRRQVEGELVV